MNIKIGQHRVDNQPVEQKTTQKSQGTSGGRSIGLGAQNTRPRSLRLTSSIPPKSTAERTPVQIKSNSTLPTGSKSGRLESSRTPVGEQVSTAVVGDITKLINKTEELKARHPMLESSLKEGMHKLGLAFEALSLSPASQPEMEEHVDHMKGLCKDLDHAISELEKFSSPMAGKSNFGDFVSSMKEMAGNLKFCVERRADNLSDAIGNAPLTEKSVFLSKTFSTKGAMALVDKQLAKLDNTNDPSGVVREIFTRTKAGLESHLEDMNARQGTAELSKEQVQHLMGSKGPDKGIKQEDIAGHLKNLFKEQLTEGPQPYMPVSSHDLREDGMLEILLLAAFEKASIEPPKDLRSQLLAERLNALNSQQWDTINKEVVVQKNGLPFAFESEIKPQSQLGKTFDDMKGGGRVCHMAQAYDHVTTLAACKIKAPDGSTIFEGTRHGTLATFDISAKKLAKMDRESLGTMVKDLLPPELWKRSGPGNHPDLEKTLDALTSKRWNGTFKKECAEAMRTQGSLNRATDISKSVLVKDDVKFARALRGETVELNINSIGLLTPSNLMAGIDSESRAGNEKRMLADQLKAWSNLTEQDQPISMTVKHPETGEDTTVKVRVNVTAFNFGVNAGALGTVKFAPHLNVISGWSNVERQNNQSMAALIGSPGKRENEGLGGRVGGWLENPPPGTTPERIEQVKTLASQIGQIFDSGSYKTPGSEPYKLVTRLAVLTHFLGDDPCWNCKSGKDRTGECHVETSMLATEIYLTGKVPEPDRPRTEEDRGNLFRMATDGGNLEIQRYNTGAAGFKLGGVPELEDLYNSETDKSRYRNFRGIAGFYGS